MVISSSTNDQDLNEIPVDIGCVLIHNYLTSYIISPLFLMAAGRSDGATINVRTLETDVRGMDLFVAVAMHAFQRSTHQPAFNGNSIETTNLDIPLTTTVPVYTYL